jgi:hypothetical protein
MSIARWDAVRRSVASMLRFVIRARRTYTDSWGVDSAAQPASRILIMSARLAPVTLSGCVLTIRSWPVLIVRMASW